MKALFANLLRQYERLRWEQLPIAALLQSDVVTDASTLSSEIWKIRETEIAGAKSEVVVLQAGSSLRFRTRFRPNSSFSTWVRTLSGKAKLELAIQVGSGDQIQTLTNVFVNDLAGNSQEWQRVSVDLSRFANEEVTLLLSVARNTGQEDAKIGLGDPRIRRHVDRSLDRAQ